MSEPGKPLSGTTVLDASHLAAGPWCAMVLADLGADVIKIERPGTGDIARDAGSVYTGDQSAVFLSFNRNKRSLALDLQNEAGSAAFSRLVEKADVFVENFKPGTTQRLGVDYATLSAINPGLIYASISAFGTDGPYSNQPANDPIIQALSGAMSLTGESDRPPARQGVSVPDFGTGMMAAVGIVSALLGRQSTGHGEHLELNLLDVEIFALGPRAQEYLINGEDQPRLGSAHPQFAPYQAFQCADGEYIYIAIINDKFWHSLCEALGHPEWEDDPAFRANSDRTRNRAQLDARIEPVIQSRDRYSWLDLFHRHGVPCGSVNTLSDTFSDPQVEHNGLVEQFLHPTLGELQTLGSPITFSGKHSTVEKPPPLLGQHSAEVLTESGFSEAEVSDLLKKGAIEQVQIES